MYKKHIIKYNPLNTEKDKLRFKKQIMNAVDHYLKYILSDFAKMHKQLKRKIK